MYYIQAHYPTIVNSLEIKSESWRISREIKTESTCTTETLLIIQENQIPITKSKHPATMGLL